MITSEPSPEVGEAPSPKGQARAFNLKPFDRHCGNHNQQNEQRDGVQDNQRAVTGILKKR